MFTEEIFERVIGEAIEAEVSGLDIKLRYKVDDVIDVMDSIHNRVMATLFQAEKGFEPSGSQEIEEEDDDYESTESCNNKRHHAPIWFVSHCLEEYKV